ncbi:unnamed protein product [Rhizoctonia solani]|uniref:DyP dimeric alpha+beta barrel domain-containing protein n=1 Tax=Rhizoctonia solani TaxID=456999 RepID=A0A8H2Y6M0_9AGAM|nr:unnamed protein product [Rhizoctonia solani]
MRTLSDLDYQDIKRHEEDKRLLKFLRTRGQVPLIPESDDYHVPRLANVQGDVLFRFPKTHERFIFFRITQPKQFLAALSRFNPTSARDVKESMLAICRKKQAAKQEDKEGKAQPERIPLKQKMIAFSRAGLDNLGRLERTGDQRFDSRPMLDDRTELGDQSEWDLLFDWEKEEGDNPQNRLGRSAEKNRKKAAKPEPLDGVVIIATETEQERNEITREVNQLFENLWSVPEHIGILDGKVRPGQHRGHEHFGFLDGISQPAIRGIEHPLPGQIQVDPGVIVMGYPGDPVPSSMRPDWAKDGTMMVFRKLEQSVLEFERYCQTNGTRWREFVPGGESAVTTMGFREEDGAALFAARLVGRWKSGAPLALAPIRDDPELAADPKRNNDFDYAVTGIRGISAREPSDFYCPFTAHARKTVPRNLDPYVSRQFLASSAIVRAAIPYGDEVNLVERGHWNVKKRENPEGFGFDPQDRGLLFSCYASHLDSGFVRQTTGFGNNDFFPITSLTPTNHGQDPIIGGPPAPNSSNELRRVLQISNPIRPPRPYREGANSQDASTQVAQDYKVADGQQVHLRLEPEDSGPSPDRFEVTGFVNRVPAGRPPPGADNPFFVTSRGGEYFFVPSISTLQYWANDERITDILIERADEARRAEQAE